MIPEAVALLADLIQERWEVDSRDDAVKIAWKAANLIADCLATKAVTDKLPA